MILFDIIETHHQNDLSNKHLFKMCQGMGSHNMYFRLRLGSVNSINAYSRVEISVGGF